MLLKILLIGIISSILCVWFKEQKSVVSSLLAAAAIIIISLLSINQLRSTIEGFQIIGSSFENSSVYFGLLLKILGISYVSDMSASLCLENGNIALSHQLQMFGKVLVLSLSIPIISSLLETVSEML